MEMSTILMVPLLFNESLSAVFYYIKTNSNFVIAGIRFSGHLTNFPDKETKRETICSTRADLL